MRTVTCARVRARVRVCACVRARACASSSRARAATRGLASAAIRARAPHAAAADDDDAAAAARWLMALRGVDGVRGGSSSDGGGGGGGVDVGRLADALADIHDALADAHMAVLRVDWALWQCHKLNAPQVPAFVSVRGRFTACVATYLAVYAPEWEELVCGLRRQMQIYQETRFETFCRPSTAHIFAEIAADNAQRARSIVQKHRAALPHLLELAECTRQVTRQLGEHGHQEHQVHYCGCIHNWPTHQATLCIQGQERGRGAHTHFARSLFYKVARHDY